MNSLFTFKNYVWIQESCGLEGVNCNTEHGSLTTYLLTNEECYIQIELGLTNSFVKNKFIAIKMQRYIQYFVRNNLTLRKACKNLVLKQQ